MLPFTRPQLHCDFLGPDNQSGDWLIDEQVEELLAPRAAPDSQNFVDEGLFSFLLNHEVQKATRLQYPLSILCLSPDLHPDKSSPLTAQLAKAATRYVRTTDVASILRDSCIALLLVDAEARNLRGILQRLGDALPLSPANTAGERRLTLSAGGGCYPQTAPNADELLQQAVELMTCAKTDGGNRLYIAPSG